MRIHRCKLKAGSRFIQVFTWSCVTLRPAESFSITRIENVFLSRRRHTSYCGDIRTPGLTSVAR